MFIGTDAKTVCLGVSLYNFVSIIFSLGISEAIMLGFPSVEINYVFTLA